MAKLLVGGDWYDAVSPGSMYETDFEALLLAHAPSLYPDFHLVPFKRRLDSEHGPAKADLALIDKLFREWWVVEVELAVHPLREHVEPQVAALATAVYGPEDADYLISKNPHLDARAVKAMMRGIPPRTLVIVNQARPEWVPTLMSWSTVLGVVEVFRSERNVEILRVNGTHPESMGDLVSVCRVDPWLSNALVVASPAGLPGRPGDPLTVAFRDGVSEWKRVEVADKVWLMPVGRYPLPSTARFFRLTKNAQGELMLEVRSGLTGRRV